MGCDQAFFDPVSKCGNSHKHSKRLIVNAMRHIVVDILANLLYVKVHAANLRDTKIACDVLEGAVDKYPSLKAFSGDAGYCGTTVDFTCEKLNMTPHIAEKIEGKWAVMPKRG